MGKISKSMIFQVPVEIAYEAVKSRETKKFLPENLQLNTQPTYVTKDIENTEFCTLSKKYYVKVETQYLFRALSEDSCEIIFNVKYPPLSPESMIKPVLALEISGYKALEFGFEEGKKQNMLSSSKNKT